MTAATRYWLMKCEPEAYTIDALARDGTTSWEGVRNFQARNFLREMRVGDLALFYASNADPSGAVGVVEVSREAYPDPLQFQKGHEYHDPTSRQEKPKWYTVEVRFVEKLPQIVSLDAMKRAPGLKKMMVVQPGRRPSVQPVTEQEFEIVRKLARGGSR
jgi:predicted RNA-binding protein with PUA-like domain